ncbi:DNA-binding protein [Clostridium sp. AF18-27]|uniref:helix-turn-helix domain-containing protein n=1 Tax=Enterocloster lavalensis TaxID=460384 RepID=UPI000E4DCD30|nr:DNA-binding protein [Clostridium sp. AF18-27]
MFDIYPGYPDLMNVNEVAAILNCKASTICRLCRTGELVAMKIGKGWSIPQSCLRDFILKKMV